jgi:hypothetical protein
VWARNSFRRLFYGRLESTPEGTRIVGEFRVHAFVRIFMAIWLFFAGAFALLYCLASLGPTGPSFWETAAACGMFLLGLGFLYVGPRLSGSEEAAVLAYICDRLEASRLAA